MHAVQSEWERLLRRIPKRGVWISAVLVAATVIQVAYLLDRVIIPAARSVWEVRSLSAVERSASLSLGDGSGEYVRFVRDLVPPEGKILLPAREVTGSRITFTESMDYYFFPHQVIGCWGLEDLACRKDINSPGVYTLVIEGFPLDNMTVDPFQSRLVPFAGDGGLFRGLLLPLGDAASPAGKVEDALPVQPSAIWFVDLVVLAALALPGGLTARAILGRGSLVDAVILSLPLGVGLFTWLLFVVSALGAPLNLASMAVVYLGFLMIAFGAVWLARKREDPDAGIRQAQSQPPLATRLAIGILVALVVGLWLAAVGLSVGESYVLHDPAQIWGIKGYGIAYEGDIRAGDTWGVHGLAYPLNVPLFASIYWLIDGDVLPGSKLIFPLLGAAMVAGSVRFLRRQGVGRLMSWVGALLVTSIPVYYNQATMGMANVPFTVYLVLGTLWSIEGLFGRRRGALLVSGLLWALACWTRAEGIFFVLALAVLLILLAGPRQVGLRRTAMWLAPVAVAAGTWFGYSLPYLMGSHLWSAVAIFRRGVGGEGVHVGRIVTILGAIARDSALIGEPRRVWGTAAIAVALVLVLAFAGRRRRLAWGALPVLLGGLVAGAMTSSIFFIRSYSRSGFEGLIERSLPRALLPAAVLLVLAAVLMLAQSAHDDGGTSSGDKPLAAGPDSI